jgi:predicted aspartyl protease
MTTLLRSFARLCLSFLCAERFFLFVAVMLSACPALRAFEDERNPSIVRFRCVKSFAAVVPVSINGSKPYEFLLDTGATYTSVDTEVARDLVLQAHREASITTLVHRIPVVSAVAHSVRIGPLTELDVEVLVRDLSGLRRLDPRIRGVLGQNVLERADYLIDYKQRLVQFDADGDLLSSLRGERTSLTRIPVPGDATHANLAVRIWLDDGRNRETRLLLDSGSASLVIFSGEGEVRRKMLDFPAPHSIVQDAAGEKRSVELRNVQLVIGGGRRSMTAEMLDFENVAEDFGGLLPTNMFLRLYISNSGGFAMFDPRIDHRIYKRLYSEAERVAMKVGGR